jgi:aminotransferase/cystathionine beta-lyase
VKKACATDKAPGAIGPYSQAIIADPGKTIYVSGQIPIDPVTSTMPTDIEGQTERCILNIKAILAATGASLDDVLKATVYLADIGDFAAMNGIYSKYFTAPFPARAAVQVAKLPKDAKVEIDAIALVPTENFTSMSEGSKYDFETAPDRRDLGSAKWEQMKNWKPDVSKGIVPFSIADMELQNPPEIVEGLKNHLDKAVLGYTVPTESYLNAVCGWMLKRHGWEIKPEWIIGAPGVVSAFFSAIKAFSKPGEGIIIQPPVYYPFYEAIERNNRAVVRNPLILKDDRYTIDYDDLERKASDPRNTILLFSSPHNPVGRVWTKDELERVGEICLRNGVLIISDEIHFDLIMPGYSHTVFATVSDELANDMIVCTAPSKTFNLAGMQTSNIIIPNLLLRERYQEQIASEGFFSLGILGYKACEIAYERCAPWLDQFLLLLQRNHSELKKFVETNIPAVKVFDLEGTYLQWMDFRGLKMEKDRLERFLHEEAEIFFDEGYVFGEEGAGYERMNLACPTKVMMDALKRLALAVSRPA